MTDDARRKRAEELLWRYAGMKHEALTLAVLAFADAERKRGRLFINPDSAAFGNGTPFEEAVIDAGTRYITRTIGHYSTGDRRFTMGLYNAMLKEAIERTPHD